MRQLQDLLAPTDVLLISDEVYEHMVFDGAAARKRGALSRAWPRAPSSCRASARPTTSPAGRSAMWPRRHRSRAEFRKVHQFNVFTVNTPVQHALGRLHGRPAAATCELPAFYQRKRDLFREGLASAPSSRSCPAKAATSSASTSRDVSDLGEAEFCLWLTSEIGVAAIPLSAFYGDGFDQRVVRFCFAKKEDTLNTALDRLAKL